MKQAKNFIQEDAVGCLPGHQESGMNNAQQFQLKNEIFPDSDKKVKSIGNYNSQPTLNNVLHPYIQLYF